MCGATISYESVCTLRVDFLEYISLHEDRISRVSDLSRIVAGSCEYRHGRVLDIWKSEHELRGGGSEDRWKGREMGRKSRKEGLNLVANVRDSNITKEGVHGSWVPGELVS